jgi:IPT/TIG domain-containing protein
MGNRVVECGGDVAGVPCAVWVGSQEGEDVVEVDGESGGLRRPVGDREGAPAGTGTVPITVTTAGGTSNPVSYSYVAPPFLTALLPAVGPTSAGNSVTFTGINLTTTQAVHFGGVPTSFTVLSDISLIAFAPPGPVGTSVVSVTTLGGTSNNIVYTRVAAPEI